MLTVSRFVVVCACCQVISHTAEVIKKLKGGRGKVVKNYASYKGKSPDITVGTLIYAHLIDG